MKGKDLWNYLEAEAKRKFKLNSLYKLRAVEIVDEEIAKVTLEDVSGIKKSGLVYYGITEPTP